MSAEAKKDHLAPPEKPELVFGLAGPVGTDFAEIADILKNELKKVRYEMVEIRVSQLMHDLDKGIPTPLFKDELYHAQMDAGDKFRGDSEDGSVLALLAALKVQAERKRITGNDRVPAEGVAYVIRSFKHPDEIEALRRIYGRAFFLVGVNTSRDQRKRQLAEKILKSRIGDSDGRSGSRAEALIERDEEEVGNDLGQRLRDTFALSDVFVNGDRIDSIRSDLRRFIELLFGHPFITPTREEYGMSLSFTVALRSSDLSRQVGAVITDGECNVLSVGCNEVPKAGGGAYWPDDANDSRDHKFGEDPSQITKIDILSELLFRLKKRGWLSEDKTEMETDELLKAALHQSNDTLEAPVMKGAKLMDLLEFGRVVHAEMHALSDAARRTVGVQDGILYCTTFPCHICARHIISSGIAKVVFIEPYPKSMTYNLYPDSVSQEGCVKEGKVVFTPFIGVSPRRYSELFVMGSRKQAKTGKAIKWNSLGGRIKLDIYPQRSLTLEGFAIEYFQNELLPRIRQARISK